MDMEQAVRLNRRPRRVQCASKAFRIARVGRNEIDEIAVKETVQCSTKGMSNVSGSFFRTGKQIERIEPPAIHGWGRSMVAKAAMASENFRGSARTLRNRYARKRLALFRGQTQSPFGFVEAPDPRQRRPVLMQGVGSSSLQVWPDGFIEESRGEMGFLDTDSVERASSVVSARSSRADCIDTFSLRPARPLSWPRMTQVFIANQLRRNSLRLSRLKGWRYMAFKLRYSGINRIRYLHHTVRLT
jgi:hypothetical protein